MKEKNLERKQEYRISSQPAYLTGSKAIKSETSVIVLITKQNLTADLF